MTRRDGNNFDLLRFLLASVVFLVHAHVLSGKPQLAFLAEYLSSDYAVKAFFVVSGFLIFQSHDRSRSLRDYFGKRVRRIYPAYFAIVLICAGGGMAVTTLPLDEYFSGGLAAYLVANLSFLNFLAPDLPGVFKDNIFQAANGALWTIKIEVMFYLLVPVIAYLFRRIGTIPVLFALYAASVAYWFVLSDIADRSGAEFYRMLARQLPGQLSYFMVGALLLYYGDRFRRWLPVAAAIAVPVLALRLPVIHPVLEPLLLGCLIIYFAKGIGYLGNFGRYGDFSYGIYIIHFPVVQLLVAWGLFSNPGLGLACSALAVLIGALLSWHIVEKPFLNRSSHYVVAAAT